jgi:hypothetical protein
MRSTMPPLHCMRKNLAHAILFCFLATGAFAQSGLNGRWMTDRQIDPLPLGERRQIVQLELNVEGDKASGSVALGGLGGTFYTFKDGKLSGNKVQFRTSVTSAGQTALTNWQVELVDENTATIGSERPNLPLVGENVILLISVLGTGVQPVARFHFPTNTD